MMHSQVRILLAQPPLTRCFQSFFVFQRFAPKRPEIRGFAVAIGNSPDVRDALRPELAVGSGHVSHPALFPVRVFPWPERLGSDMWSSKPLAGATDCRLSSLRGLPNRGGE